MVEEDVQGPMHEPGALLDLLQGWGKCVEVDQLFQLVQVLKNALISLATSYIKVTSHHNLRV